MAGGAEPRWGSGSGAREEAWFNGLGVLVGFSGSAARLRLARSSRGASSWRQGRGRGRLFVTLALFG